MLDDFVSHIEQTKGQSLLSRIYGMFSIKTKDLREIDIIIMQNTSKLVNKNAKKFEFDIKGSLVGRKTEVDPRSNDIKTLKDMNLLEI